MNGISATTIFSALCKRAVQRLVPGTNIEAGKQPQPSRELLSLKKEAASVSCSLAKDRIATAPAQIPRELLEPIKAANVQRVAGAFAAMAASTDHNVALVPLRR